MSALTQARSDVVVRFKSVPLPLAAALTAYTGGMACIDIVAGSCKPGVAANANLVRVGSFAESIDNSAGTGTAAVMVKLDKELVGQWYENATGAAAVVTLFTNAYILDDHTVTVTSGSNSIAGRVWAIDTVKGVLVETTNL